MQAPFGYVLDSTPVPFTVNADNADEENAVNIVRVTKADTAQKGRISVTKRGEVFSSVSVTEDERYMPVFEEAGLTGAEFEVTAAEDIVTPDGTVRLAAGETAAVLITDSNGFAETEPLYLGKYTVKETAAPFGYVCSDNARTVELTYAGQDILIRDAVNCEFANDYQEVSIHLEKYMEHDELFGIGDNDEYANVAFGLYSAEEIASADGSVIPENGLIAQVSLNEDMTAAFEEKLPFAKYYVQEISTDDHFIISGEKYGIDLEYAGQEQAVIDIDCGTFGNELKRGSVAGRKVNEHGEPLEKAMFGLFRADENDFTADNAYRTSISDADGSFSFTGIPCGRYIVREIASPDGYVLSEKEYPVVIDEEGAVVEITAENVPVPEERTPVTPSPPTGDTGRDPLGLVMLAAGICGMILISYRYRKYERAIEGSEDQYAALCPDFIEGEAHEED